MKTKAKKALDSDLIGATQAMVRASERALRLARETVTPCYVLKDGRIVDLNAQLGRVGGFLSAAPNRRNSSPNDPDKSVT